MTSRINHPSTLDKLKADGYKSEIDKCLHFSIAGASCSDSSRQQVQEQALRSFLAMMAVNPPCLSKSSC